MEGTNRLGIIVATHGGFGAELIKSAEMIIGKQDQVKSIALLPGLDLGDFMAELQEILAAMSDHAVILCDLFGGTPSNVAAAILLEKDVYSVSGVNLAMLIEACTMRDSVPDAMLIDNILAAGQNGCKNIAQAMQRENE